MAQNVALFTISCFLTPIWHENSGLRFLFYYQQSDNDKTHLQKKISLKNALFLSILWFQVERKKIHFFQKMCILFLSDNQHYFILNYHMMQILKKNVSVPFVKYSYKANKWIFTWYSKHMNSFCKEKGKKRKIKQSMSQSCSFSWFSFKFS